MFDQDGADDRLKAWVEKHRGRRLSFVYERGRQSRLQSLLPVDARATFKPIDETNNKFSLAVADL